MLKPTVTIIGHVCIDHNMVDGVKHETWGSPAMYIAKYYLKHFGIQSNIVSSYGRDFLNYAGDFSSTEGQGSGRTMCYENTINNGQRVQYCRNSEQSTPVSVSKVRTSLLRQTDILIVAPLVPNYSVEYVSEIMRYLRSDCLKILLPQGYMRYVDDSDKVQKRNFVEAGDIMRHFDGVVASDEDYEDIMSLAKVWSNHKPNSSIVITQAERGATLFYKGEVKQISTVPLPFDKIKNPVGCGDVFSAQLAMGLYSQLHPHEAVRQANKGTAQALLADPLDQPVTT